MTYDFYTIPLRFLYCPLSLYTVNVYCHYPLSLSTVVVMYTVTALVYCPAL